MASVLVSTLFMITYLHNIWGNQNKILVLFSDLVARQGPKRSINARKVH